MGDIEESAQALLQILKREAANHSSEGDHSHIPLKQGIELSIHNSGMSNSGANIEEAATALAKGVGMVNFLYGAYLYHARLIVP